MKWRDDRRWACFVIPRHHHIVGDEIGHQILVVNARISTRLSSVDEGRGQLMRGKSRRLMTHRKLHHYRHHQNHDNCCVCKLSVQVQSHVILMIISIITLTLVLSALLRVQTICQFTTRFIQVWLALRNCYHMPLDEEYTRLRLSVKLKFTNNNSESLKQDH